VAAAGIFSRVAAHVHTVLDDEAGDHLVRAAMAAGETPQTQTDQEAVHG